MKFVDDLPETKSVTSDERERLVKALRANRGKWAEVRRYPQASGAHGARRRWSERHEDVEAAVRRDGTDWILYLRAVEVTA